MNGVIIVTTKFSSRRSFIITDEPDGTPLSGATVTLYSEKDSIILCSDKNGRVVVDEIQQVKKTPVRITRVGYEPKEAHIRWTKRSHVPVLSLKRKTALLDTVIVKGYSITCRRYCRTGCAVFRYHTYADAGIQSSKVAATLYPNPAPAGSVLQIKDNGISISSIQLVNAAGQTIHTHQNNSKQNTLQCQLPIVAPGIYFVRLTNTAKQMQTQKLIIR